MHDPMAEDRARRGRAFRGARSPCIPEDAQRHCSRGRELFPKNSDHEINGSCKRMTPRYTYLNIALVKWEQVAGAPDLLARCGQMSRESHRMFTHIVQVAEHLSEKNHTRQGPCGSETTT